MPRTPLDGAFFLLLVMVVVSIWATPDLGFSLPKVVGLLFGIVVFYSAVRWLKNPHRVWLGCHLFGVAGAALALLALVGTNWLAKFQILHGVTSHLPKLVRGLAGAEEGFQPNAVAGALVLFIPLQCALVLSKSDPQIAETSLRSWLRQFDRLRKTQLLPLILTSGTLLITQSRGAWIGFTLGLVLFVICYKRQLWKWILLLVLVGIMGFLFLLGGKLGEMQKTAQGANVELSVAGRLEVWSRGIYAIQDFPFTGMGMNMFRRVMPILYPSFLTSADFDVAHAHNHLLQAALDLGLPGLIGYLGVWLGVGYLLLFSYRRSKHVWLKNAASGLGAGLIAHFVFGMGDAIPLGAKVGIVFWLALALAVAIFQIAFCEVYADSRQATEIRHTCAPAE